MTRVKVSTKHQIAVPAEVRKQLNIKSGDHLLLEVHDGVAVLVPEPHDYAERLRGLHKEVWQGVDGQTYVHEERDAWTT